MLGKILYPSDLSPFSQKGLSWVAAKVARKESEIVIAHVVNPAAGYNTPHLVREAEIRLAVMEQSLLPYNLHHDTVALAGEEFETLAEYAQNEGCTLAILLAEPDDDLLAFVHHLAIPQLILKTDGEVLPERDLFEHVVIAVGLFEERTERLLEAARAFLEGKDASVTLLHAVPLDDPGNADLLVQAADAALQTVSDALTPLVKEVRTRLVSGYPEEELPAALKQLEPSLLVLGVSQHSELWEVLVGSVAKALIEETPCHILIVPN
jgi:nucleotide-binding universal stress UspA family protein